MRHDCLNNLILLFCKRVLAAMQGCNHWQQLPPHPWRGDRLLFLRDQPRTSTAPKAVGSDKSRLLQPHGRGFESCCIRPELVSPTVQPHDPTNRPRPVRGPPNAPTVRTLFRPCTASSSRRTPWRFHLGHCQGEYSNMLGDFKAPRCQPLVEPSVPQSDPKALQC